MHAGMQTAELPPRSGESLPQRNPESRGLWMTGKPGPHGNPCWHDPGASALGVVALDHAGRITNVSGIAQHLLEQRDGILIRDGRLAAACPFDNRRLQAVLGCAAQATQPEAGAGALLISRGGDKGPLQMTVWTLVSMPAAVAGQPRILVFLSDPAAAPASRAATLRALYGLTPAESRVADLLLEGCELRTAAQRLGTTVETARFHLKRILMKTDTRRQAELMRLMLLLPPALPV